MQLSNVKNMSKTQIVKINDWIPSEHIKNIVDLEDFRKIALGDLFFRNIPLANCFCEKIDFMPFVRISNFNFVPFVRKILQIHKHPYKHFKSLYKFFRTGIF